MHANDTRSFLLVSRSFLFAVFLIEIVECLVPVAPRVHSQLLSRDPESHVGFSGFATRQHSKHETTGRLHDPSRTPVEDSKIVPLPPLLLPLLLLPYPANKPRRDLMLGPEIWAKTFMRDSCLLGRGNTHALITPKVSARSLLAISWAGASFTTRCPRLPRLSLMPE